MSPPSSSTENNTSCWRVTYADQLHADFATLGLPASGRPRLTEAENKPWGMRDDA